MPVGVFRRVILIGAIALKIPRWRNFIRGLRCNRWEREMWRTWRPVFRWDNLCPVLFADLVGLVVVMPRASQPVTSDEVDAAMGDYDPDVTSETKVEDFGCLGKRVVVLDYGLPDDDMVRERRAYYEKMSAVAA